MAGPPGGCHQRQRWLLRRRAAGFGPGGGGAGESSPVAGRSIPTGGGATDPAPWRRIQPQRRGDGGVVAATFVFFSFFYSFQKIFAECRF